MNKIKFLTILMILSAFASQTVKAQEEDDDIHEKIKARKVAYITEKLDLSVEEAQKFWPLYNEHEAEMEALMTERKSIMKKIKKADDTMTDEELEKLVDQMVAIESKEADIHAEYYKKVKKVLPIRKVMKLFHVEREFKRELLKEFRGHKHGGRGEGRMRGGHGGPSCEDL